MRYTEEKITSVLEKCNIANKVFFVGILPSFTFDLTTKDVVDYHLGPTPHNDLVVYNTEVVEVETTLEKYFKSLDLGINDVFVFCINQDYIPKENQLRYKLIVVK